MRSRTRIVSTILLAGFVAAFLGCRSGGDTETETEPEARAEPQEEEVEERPLGPPAGEAQVLEQEPSPSWLASIEGAGPGIGINGEAVAHAGESGTFVSIDVEGGESGAAHPWHVHLGDCGSGGAVVGAESAYPPLQIGAGGEAEAEATISERLDPEAEYHVNIHLSAAQADSIIACGGLVTQTAAPQ
jgi:hypothetical protein